MVTLIEDPAAGQQTTTDQQPSHSLRTRTSSAKPKKNALKNVYKKKNASTTGTVLEADEKDIKTKLISTTSASTPEDAESLIDAVREQLSQIAIQGSSSHKSNKNERHESTEEGNSCASISLLPDKTAYEVTDNDPTPTQPITQQLDEQLKDIEEKREPAKPSKPRAATRQKGDTKSQQTYVNDQTRTSYVQPILNEGMSTRSSRGIQHFDKWANRAVGFFDVRKIAEGSYGEVYELCAKDGVSKASLSSSRSSKLQAYMDGVFKIVPLCAQRGPGSKKFTTVQEIVAEVQLLKLLDPIPGFARFREIHVVQGRFPPSYQDAWNLYSQTKDDCFNPDPSKKKSYPDNQLWAILEMENAGFELEKFKFSSVFQVYDIFWGVALALARAEQYASFEHRDLHLGNVCVKQKQPPQKVVRRRKSSDDDAVVEFSACLGTSGLETTIIDYSLSRAELPLYETPEAAPTCETVAWSDLEKKDIFDAVGRDEEEKFLRDTYRMMRSEVFSSPSSNTEQWKSYRPRTNLIWLSFILTTLVNKCHSEKLVPTHRQPLGQRSANSNLQPKSSNTKAKQAKNIKGKQDVEESKLSDEMQQVLFERLETVQDLLELEDEYENLSCAGDLVAIAIGSQWLAESDFLC
ncbi:serine/threonine-protein kinase Haspin [Arthroderma uncinatum]|uniref:serine/threonine-protein kinase Haspin n=1 Tax=Arthroderma uncinatum TaxID=74035 RepID=UPI00144A8A7E|nr:serine/threonine-protein kinase Haspin [Arthroderma uncinatum]KAF3483629.1 serine/threonine-protein kinase Haspin [Arthroderma uncinatum]